MRVAGVYNPQPVGVARRRRKDLPYSVLLHYNSPQLTAWLLPLPGAAGKERAHSSVVESDYVTLVPTLGSLNSHIVLWKRLKASAYICINSCNMYIHCTH